MTRHKVKIKVKYWPLYSLLGVLLIMFGTLGIYIYTYNEDLTEVAINSTDKNISDLSIEEKATADSSTKEVVWQDIYPDTKPMTIGSSSVVASIAQSWPERIKGLSGTPFLPEGVVKLFVFDAPGHHSIWMKDMNYAIDILWVNKEGVVVYLAEDASPESYPAMFVPTEPATFVIETAAGFVAKEGISVGDKVVLPKL